MAVQGRADVLVFKVLIPGILLLRCLAEPLSEPRQAVLACWNTARRSRSTCPMRTSNLLGLFGLQRL